MEHGHNRRPPEPLGVQQERCRSDLSLLPPAARELVDPVAPTVQVSAALATLTEQVRKDIQTHERGSGPGFRWVR